MALRFGVVGCGYVGAAVATHLRGKGFELTGTVTNPARLSELCELVDHPRIYRAGEPGADPSFLDGLDGLLIAMAPSGSSFDESQYRSVFGVGVADLVQALQSRRRQQPLHVIYLSSAGVYGDQAGALCHEQTSPDQTTPANALLLEAEGRVLGLNSSPQLQACVLRLGGIYGPGKDIAAYIRSASGEVVPKNGSHINAWVHRDDIVRGVDFAFNQRLEGVYNLVDDLQLSRRELSNALCDEEGLAPVIWENHDRPGARVFNARVSNNRLRQLGFTPRVASMLTSLPVG